MGTSSSFKGPKNNSPLLPSWANDGTNTGTNENEAAPAQPERPEDGESGDSGENVDGQRNRPPKEVKWSRAKNAMSRLGNDSGDEGLRRNAGRSYVRTRGGARGATRAARQGISAIAGLGGFLGDIAGRGFDQALRDAGLEDCIGKPAEEVFAILADRLAPAGGVIDESITRNAIIDSLCYLYDKLTDEEGQLQNAEALGPNEVKEALMLATQQYIYHKWLNEVGITLERKDLSEADLVEAERDIRDFVGESVREAFKDVDVTTFSFNNQSVVTQIDTIFRETYSLIDDGN